MVPKLKVKNTKSNILTYFCLMSRILHHFYIYKCVLTILTLYLSNVFYANRRDDAYTYPFSCCI